MRDNSPKSINILLKTLNNSYNSSLSQIQQHAVNLFKLNSQVLTLLPVTIRPWCRVANFTKSKIILETANANFMIILQHHRTLLIKNLRKNFLPLLSSMNIKIQPSLAIIEQLDIHHNIKLQINKNKNLVKSPTIVLSVKSATFIRNVAAHSEGKLRLRLEQLANIAHSID
ncbi:DUF721 domain-containing protein [Candidatus Palibaumannia cicadellinicola]|uniref:DUF721 domain-containing protein n=1 Tax=Candidatus Palibaumannia cicadellinicola TaxID=186490 RepID=A0A0K2BLI8_9GAMM|nr:DciA family protein [Candidatus Baumannia cicadellinicola]AKZ66044.1 hypothetical protein AB162_461 [Candidatus Baumannia cicadellinicola]